MSKLSKREPRFNHKEREIVHKLRGFHKPQRLRVVLAADEKPMHGVSQEMPERDKP